MSHVLLIDNYDSFTYNLAQYLMVVGAEVTVAKNDETSIRDIDHLQPTHIVISPGPGRPEEVSMIARVITTFYDSIPILGVCLGHQGIASAFGGRVVHAVPVHGKTSQVFHDGTGIFKNVPSPIDCVRYHSLVIDPDTLPRCLHVTAKTENGLIMAVRHENGLLEGVQFHPESILSQHGMDILRNFIQ